MKKVRLKNSKINDLDIFFASSLYERMIGLMGKKVDFGLIIPNCNSIQTFFMKEAIDTVFLNKKNEAVKLLYSIKPWRISGVYLKANKVLELPSGSIKKYQISLGEEFNYEYI